jgi:hypothetical protein
VRPIQIKSCTLPWTYDTGKSVTPPTNYRPRQLLGVQRSGVDLFMHYSDRRFIEPVPLRSLPGSHAGIAICTEVSDVDREGYRTLKLRNLGMVEHVDVEAEVAAWLSTHTDKLTDDGRRRLVRHGHLPEREIVTGIGAVAVRCPRVRDRVGEGGEHIRFSSASSDRRA